MPVYEYNCVNCGKFTNIRPMALSTNASPCISCGALSNRALATPIMYSMSAERKKAFQTNERSSNEPVRRSAKTTEGSNSKHKPNCSCCSSKSKNKSTLHLPDGSKTFPTKRSWMISHQQAYLRLPLGILSHIDEGRPLSSHFQTSRNLPSAVAIMETVHRFLNLLSQVRVRDDNLGVINAWCVAY